MSTAEAKDFPEVLKNKENIFLKKIGYRLRQIRPYLNRRKIVSNLNELDTNILKQLSFFSERTNLGVKDYEGRLYEISVALDKVCPSSIIEIGSGRSSLVFAAWAKKNNAQFSAYEQLEEWAELSNEAIKPFGMAGAVKLLPLQEIPDLGGRFQEDVPLETEFLYVDGPTISGSRKAKTFSGKSAYTDAADLIRRGGRPKLIMIEGRGDSVDLLLSESKKAELDFEFQPGFEWAIRRNDYKGALKCLRHSYFYYK